jgi:hypothetical protein
MFPFPLCRCQSVLRNVARRRAQVAPTPPRGGSRTGAAAMSTAVHNETFYVRRAGKFSIKFVRATCAAPAQQLMIVCVCRYEAGKHDDDVPIGTAP